ncbi:MAG: hypothetical protein IT305_30520 [Chloroflexi bacterium]|nr:hypothetical protein [Chloroflexota bacterium]
MKIVQGRSGAVVGALVGALMLAFGYARPAVADAALPLSLGDARLLIYPLGTALVEVRIGNPTTDRQDFWLQLVLTRPDGTIAVTETSEVYSMAPGTDITMLFTIQNANGATRALVLPRSPS